MDGRVAQWRREGRRFSNILSPKSIARRRRRRPQKRRGKSRENLLKSLPLITFLLVIVAHEWSGNRLIQTALQRRRGGTTDDALSLLPPRRTEGERGGDCHLQLIRGAMSEAEEDEQLLQEGGEGTKGNVKRSGIRRQQQ